jgi:hypothetical protein
MRKRLPDDYDLKELDKEKDGIRFQRDLYALIDQYPDIEVGDLISALEIAKYSLLERLFRSGKESDL